MSLALPRKRERGRKLADQYAELTALAVVPDDAIDSSDAPELFDWSGAERGLFYRSVTV
jgi:hypothetical protein